jgi:hypothetical protein
VPATPAAGLVRPADAATHEPLRPSAGTSWDQTVDVRFDGVRPLQPCADSSFSLKAKRMAARVYKTGRPIGQAVLFFLKRHLSKARLILNCLAGVLVTVRVLTNA